MSVRAAFEATVQRLVGLQVLSVDYRDLDPLDGELEHWDHGDWHNAVMGIELHTSEGTRTVTWGSTFECYGIEIIEGELGEDLCRNGPEGDSFWSRAAGQRIEAATIGWQRWKVGASSWGPIRRWSDVDVPIALRLDFAAGPVWLLVAVPEESGGASVGGDEMMVVLSGALMRDLASFDDRSFAR
ncbi:MAG: hypothetical protein QM572_09125 [Nocardioides sp.]|uniref:hypothetical protein n=1 Tax=Nocardioides sp. TaxID=35761 RepID=UPI0039E35DCC